MKLFAVVVTFLAFFSLLISAFAQNPELSVSEANIQIFNIAPDNERSIELTIKNTDIRFHTFEIRIFPSFWPGLSIVLDKNILELVSSEVKSTKISFSASPDATFTTKVFTITTTAIDKPELQSNLTVLLTVQRKSPVFIVSLAIDKESYEPEESVKITSKVTNEQFEASEQFALETLVKDGDTVLQRKITTVEPIPARSSKEFADAYTIPKTLKPGTYTVQSRLIDSLGFVVSISKPAPFVVLAKEEVSETKSLGIGFLTTTTTVTAKNEGNVPRFLHITVVVPNIAKGLFVPETEPSSIETFAGGVVYKWISPSEVAVDEQFSIRYQFVVWHIWLTMLGLAGVVYFAYKFVFTPTIIKTHTHRGPLIKEKEVFVSLDVRNRSAYEVKDISVRDFVPAVAKVVPRFETVKPQVKESPQGTELVWRIDSLKPGEERVLTYRIKPTVDVIGSLQLPSAQLRYVDRKKQRKVRVSREILVR